MFFSLPQVRRSLERLKGLNPFFGMSYLAFKKVRLPIGETRDFRYSIIANEILKPFYQPTARYKGYYNPFKTSKPSSRWVSPRYESTSLQRVTADTFSEAFVHKKGSHEWGWRDNYIERLGELRKRQHSTKIPAFDLAVWLFRNREWPNTTSPEQVIETLFQEFEITDSEQKTLFDVSTASAKSDWKSELAVGESDLLKIIGWPPGDVGEEGAALVFLELKQVGPAKKFRYDASDRLNIVTGDNSLGKTFLLECVWWALTGQWIDQQAAPRRTKSKYAPTITFSVHTSRNIAQSFSSKYNWDQQSWEYPSNKKLLAGLAIYARYDGSFVIWDPARTFEFDESDLVHPSVKAGCTILTRQKIWDGLTVTDSHGREQHLCNGLIRDWITWQTGGAKYEKIFSAFSACLKILSPSAVELLTPGESVRLPRDSRDIPTLSMPYGTVPILHASAGVQRILALAYLMVWAWHEHLENANLIRRKPQKKIVLLIDEVEAHLHPKWQRAIVPSIIDVIGQLSDSLSAQVHLATHSPLVLASAEPIFDKHTDGLHHLDLFNEVVRLTQVDFIKHGSADAWLMSEIFGLAHARSLAAEQAIEAAKRLQLQQTPDPNEVRRVNADLTRHLADDDDFWPRWRFFAEQHGVGE